MVSNQSAERFHKWLMEDEQFNEACMRVALQVAQYYQGEGPLDEESLQLAMHLCTRVSVA